MKRKRRKDAIREKKRKEKKKITPVKGRDEETDQQHVGEKRIKKEKLKPFNRWGVGKSQAFSGKEEKKRPLKKKKK